MQVQTSSGTVDIRLETAAKFEVNGVPGKVALGILRGTYVLIWRTNGDWQCFIDGAELDSDSIDGWEPAAIWQADEEIATWLAEIGAEPDMVGNVDYCLDYYLDWASVAEDTLIDAKR